MANFDQLKQSVAALIRTNGAEEITGQIMQDVLLTIINSISGGYMFGGVAQHSGNVGNPDYNVFYLAGSGAYTGYGDAINIPNGCYGVFRYNGSWTQDVVDIGVHLTGTIREGETNGVTGDVINTALQTLFNNVMNILDTLTFAYNTPSAQQATKAMLDVIVTPTGGASHVLTTLTLVSATVAAAGLMSAEDKQKVDRMLTDFRSLSFSDTTEVADQATKIVQTLSATLGENPEAITTMTFLAATASKAGLLSAADKAKLDAILGNLRSLKIDDTTAYADLGTKIVESIKATIGGTEETISTFQILAATASKAGLLSAADKAKLDALWSSGYQFAGIATPSTTPISTTSKIFYIATEAGTYFNAVTVTQGINILSWNGTSWSAVQVIGIDDEPTADSGNLVKSGGVYNFKDVIAQITDNNADMVIIDKNMNCIVYFQNGHIITKNFDSRIASRISFENLPTVDFAIADDNGYDVAVIKDGWLITKKFDSRKSAQSEESYNNGFAVLDEKGNAILSILDGHVITKNFDSRNGNAGEWSGKNICIIGDSLTEQNWYPSVMANELNCTIYNRGWSGSPVTPMNTFSGNKSHAFTHRFDLADNNQPGNGVLSIEHAGTPSTDIVDLMLIFGGTNDWGHGYIGDTSSSYTPIRLGSLADAMSDVANDPEDSSVGASFYAALKYTCYKAKEKYPNVPLALCTLLPSFGYEAASITTNRSSEYIVHSDMSVTLQTKQFLDGYKTKADFNQAIRDVAKQFGAYVIDLDKLIGFPDFSKAMADLYYNNGDMTHPSQNYGSVVLGKFIANYIRNFIVYMDKNV